MIKFIAILAIICFIPTAVTANLVSSKNIPQELIEDINDVERYLIKQDPLRLVENGYFKIKTKEGKLVNFYPNKPQRRFIKLVRTLLKTGKPVSIVIDKARQWGGSTVTELIGYAIISQRENINGLIIADDDKGAAYILDMSRLVQEEMEKDFPYLVEPTIRSNRNELAFRHLRSRMFIDSARNVYAGQKYTLQFLHASEVSKYLHADEMFAGLLPAIAEVPWSLRIWESTPNGVGNYFHKIVKEAEENTKKYKDGDFSNYEGEMILFFVPAWEYEEYTRQFRSEKDKQEFVNSMDDDEKRYLNSSYITADGVEYVTLEQLHWRRFTIQNTYHGDVDQFNQYYPVNIDIGFLVSGRPRFDAHRVKEIYEYTLTLQPQVGYFAHPTETELTKIPGIKPDSVLFHNDPRGEWTIWEMPDHRCEYVEFCDPAGGEEIEGSPEGKKGDFNCIHIFKRCDLGRLEQVAEYRSRIDPDLLADEAYLGWEAYFNPYCVGVEVTGVGRTTADHLKHKAPVYRREVMDEVTKKVTRKLGWSTDVATRKTMIDEMAAGIRDGWLIIRSTVLASECRTFVKDSKGKYQAQEGCFDDTVMCCAGAIQMHLRTPMKSDMARIKVHNPGVRG